MKKTIEIALKAGLKRNQLILDPGIGFGKTPEQNMYVMKRLEELVYYKDFYYKMVEKYRLNIPEGELFSGSEDLGEKIDIFLCLGGDGTFLESLTVNIVTGKQIGRAHV